MKIVVKAIVSLTGIICVAYILSVCIDHGIDGTIVATGLSFIGFFVGLMYDVVLFKKGK